MMAFNLYKDPLLVARVLCWQLWGMAGKFLVSMLLWIRALEGRRSSYTEHTPLEDGWLLVKAALMLCGCWDVDKRFVERE